jgi:hypothetical protein
MSESSLSSQIKLLKKSLYVFQNIVKNYEKNNSLEEKIKNKKQFLSYLEEKFKKFNVNENERKIILNSIEKKFDYKNTKPIDITKKKYNKVKIEIDTFLEINKKKDGKKEFEFFMNELSKIISKYKFNKSEIGQILLYSFKQKNIDEKIFKTLLQKYSVKLMKKTLTMLEKYEKSKK